MLKRIFLTISLCIALLASGSCGSNAASGGSDHSGGAYGMAPGTSQALPASTSVAIPEIMLPGPLDPVWGADEVMLLAVAHLGNFTSIEGLKTSRFYPLFKSLYPEINDISTITVDTGSGDLWLIKPMMPNMSLAVNEYGLSMFMGDKSEDDAQVYYRTEQAQPIIIRMNADDPGQVKIIAVDNERHSLEWIPTTAPQDNLLRTHQGVTDITFHPIDWVAQPGQDYVCDLGSKKVRLRFYGDGQMFINDKPGRYISYLTTTDPDAVALYFIDNDGREGSALLNKWEQDERAFNVNFIDGYDLGLGKLATFTPM